ncbi:hypothetical protein DFJ63DRAFT_229310 [Scheffersomyces coipomensis]|uniref:uncharacterized protein n=1 Tax=Scheffersomyces coipomensis TaxID=1788519 RepID=UPI00315D5521
MLRSLGARRLGVSLVSPAVNNISRSVLATRFNSDFNNFKNNSINQSKESKRGATISDINDLLNSSLEHTDSNIFNSKSSQYGTLDLAPQPRDTAKKIKIFGPLSGRTIDVQHNSLGRAFGQIRRLGFDNRIKYFQKVQERYIRPAKYRKQKKREWWRKKFSEGFKDLMAEVNDARRRGY